jgi:hypothetical protein
VSAAADAVRLHTLQERARQATAHAAKLADHLQAVLDDGGDPAWYMVAEMDRRHEAMVAALAEVAVAEAEIAAQEGVP